MVNPPLQRRSHMSSTELLLDAAGHQRSPVTMPGYHQGRPPKNKGQRFPADPPPVEEIIAVMRATGNGADGARLRALIIVLWRAGLRISEALDLAETDLDRSRGAVLVRAGKGGRRREVGMDRWAWDQLTTYLEVRAALPVGALFCVLHGPRQEGAGRPQQRADSCAERRKRPASVDASRLINMPTLSLCRCWLRNPRRSGGSRRSGGHNAGGARLWIEPLDRI